MEKYVRVHHQLLDFSRPRVMAIINLSADSFYTSCADWDENRLLSYVEGVMQSGADMLDIGACSTRPHSLPVAVEEEWRCLSRGLDAIRHHWHEAIISVDTFRAAIAHKAIEHGADIINDVYGGDADSNMWDVVAQKEVPYVLTHAQSVEPIKNCDVVTHQVLHFLCERINMLYQRGVKDVIIDPGFGFGKSVEQNYALLRQLHVLDVLHAPLLVGLSRKSIFYKPLNKSPKEVLPATVAAHMLALQQGANILRVHDVDAAQQAITVFLKTHKL